MSSLFKMPLPVEQVKMTRIYNSEKTKDFAINNITCDKMKEVYGELKFEQLYEDRPYTFTSLVTSIDGRIAFTDAPQGPLISRKNKYDPDGAMADWWILNMLRTVSDGIIVGARTMEAEPDFTGHIFDEELENARISAGLPAVPYNIITSLDGTDIPFDHVMFSTPELPLMISTSKTGLDYVLGNIKNEYVVVGPYADKSEVLENYDAVLESASSKGKVIIIATGDTVPNSHISLYALKKMGIDKLLVETPSYAHYLAGEQMMDELFFNYSCLLIGGKALTIGQFGKEFTSENHPHTRMLSIHAHSDHFFYFRHKLIYN